MTYLENLSLVELAEHYATYRDDRYLGELANRDKLSKLNYDERMWLQEPDNQMVFDFHKNNLVSAQEIANNTSVNDQWKEAYEVGFRAGMKMGEKNAFAEVGLKFEKVSALNLDH